MPLKEKIEAQILNLLPRLSQDIAADVANTLTSKEIGVTTARQLKDVERADMPMLSAIDARTLTKFWRKKYGDDFECASDLQSTSGYAINWKEIPEDIMLELKRGHTLTKKQRCLMINLIVNNVKAKVPGVKRHFFKSVGQDLVKAYPRSLQDAGTTGGSVYISSRLAEKFDETNRGQRSMTEAPNIPAAYGCLRWRVLELPEGESDSSLKDKQNELIEMYECQRAVEWDWERIKELMTQTYCYQRRDINSQLPMKRKAGAQQPKSTKQIAQEWPFLFERKGMNIHFNILTGKNFERSVVEFMNEFDHFFAFLEDKSSKCSKIMRKMRKAQEKRTCSSPELTALMLMLLTIFNENEDLVLQEIEATTDMSDLKPPATPCIFSLGEPFKAKKFFFGVDGEAIRSMKSFGEALVLLFCSYFVLNIKYPKEAGNTLDFIQRVIVKIEPQRGSKVSASKSKRKSKGSLKLLALNDEFKEYCDKNFPEEDEDAGEELD